MKKLNKLFTYALTAFVAFIVVAAIYNNVK